MVSGKTNRRTGIDMKVIDGKFDKKEMTTLEKLTGAIDSLQLEEDDKDTEFALVVYDREGYTTIGTSLSIAEAIFLLESAKIGLLSGEPTLSDTLQQEESMSGKGSSPRPIPNPETFDSNWDAIFKKKDKPKDKPKDKKEKK